VIGEGGGISGATEKNLLKKKSDGRLPSIRQKTPVVSFVRTVSIRPQQRDFSDECLWFMDIRIVFYCELRTKKSPA
jgi:hypothetical protein